ncbi:MFS transporter [Acrocarpospora macrocephala]|uniref:MFS transporter n=1 Tax=Acrocarpospora macrocephala TaxID=150177 RepID=A0A5M3WQX6_9ACTN|nr:MFS transporter [Acrocarpospora macrocephala]GES11757.1 MFS transporter [Acrocarpospora macrocephala]
MRHVEDPDDRIATAPASSAGNVGALLLIANLGWAVPSVAGATLLQALVAEIDPARKIAFYGLLSTVGAACASLGMVVSGILSDRTRSRFGQRKPWILGGGLLAAASLSAVGLVTYTPAILMLYALYHLGQSAMHGALFALVPDLVDRARYGRASGLAGLGLLLGQTLGGFAAASFLTLPARGLVVLPWLTALVAILTVSTLPSSRPGVRPHAPPSIRAAFKLPTDADFWRAFAGRFLFLLAFYLILSYHLYVLTDYFHVAAEHTGRVFASLTLVFAVGAAVCVALSGGWSDRMGRRKPLVVGSSVLLAAAVLPPAWSDQLPSFYAFFGLAGLAFGTYLAVDQALMADILPERANTARDLAVLNVANSLPHVLAPGIAGLIVTATGYAGIFVAASVAAVLSAIAVQAMKTID